MGRGTQERVCIPRKKVNADENAHFFLSSRSQSREHAQSWTSFCYIKRRLSPLRKERGEQHLFQRIGTLRVWTTYCVCLARVWVSEHEENKPEGNWELRKRNGRCTNHLFGACLLLLFLFLFLCQPTGTMYPREHIVDAVQVLAVLWVSNYVYCTQQQHPRQQHQPHVANQIPA